jgi:hypothetical protein
VLSLDYSLFCLSSNRFNNSPYAILIFVAEADQHYSLGNANAMSASLPQQKNSPTLKASNNARAGCCSPSASDWLIETDVGLHLLDSFSPYAILLVAFGDNMKTHFCVR